jgi:hypothetical protein
MWARAPLGTGITAATALKVVGVGARSQSCWRQRNTRFLWPSPADGVVTITSAQLGYLPGGIDWRCRTTPGDRWLRADRDILNRRAVAGTHKHYVL